MSHLRVVFAAVLLSAAAAAPARAGTYDVYGCKDPDTGKQLGPNLPSGWSFEQSHPNESNFSLYSSCSSALGGIGVAPFDAGGSAQITGDNTNIRGGYMGFSAPPGTTIRGFSVYRTMQVSGQRAFVLYRYDDASIAEFCHGYFDTCKIGDPSIPLSSANQDSATFGGAGIDDVVFALKCDGPNCAKQTSAASIRVYSSKFTLEDDETPTFSSPPGGSLLAAGDVSGTRTLDYVAADVGGGVHKISVSSSATSGSELASKVVDSGNGHCDAAKFTYVVPCPSSIDGSLDVDTLQFPDGEQSITITIEDAAGNRKTATRTITVTNAPESKTPPSISAPGTIKAGDQLTCDPGTFSPDPERLEYAWLVDDVPVDAATDRRYTVRTVDVGKTFVCRVTAIRGGGRTTVDSKPVPDAGPSDGGPSPGPTSTPQPPTTGSSAPGGDTTIINAPGSARFTAASKTTRHIRYGQRATLTGQLLDADAQPVRGASIAVLSAVARKGAVRRQVGTVTTDANGAYRWVAPVGVSRNIRFVYHSGGNQAQVDVALKVRAKLSFRALHRHVRPYGRMHLRGRVYGKGLPARGALVEIQYRDGTHWETAKVRRTHRGRFVFDYKFKRTAHGSFIFRARMRTQTGIPLLGSASKPLGIRVG